jgi:hypothetical protein
MARKIYILTENGIIKGATFHFDKAENWMGLGNDFDYIPVYPEQVFDKDQAPTPATQLPTKAQERTQDIMKRQQELQRRLDKTERRLTSPLLQPEEQQP